MSIVPVPLLVSVTLSEDVAFTAMLPKLRLVALAPRTNVELTALPVIGIAIGEPAALLEIATLPVSVPAAPVALKVAVNVAVPPAEIAADGDTLETLKPVPEADMPETVTLALPLFFNVTVCELEFPIETLPNETLLGLAVMTPCVPVPDMLTETAELAALVVSNLIAPDALPDDVGANLAVNDVLSPEPRVIGVDKPE
jgi:phosphoribosylcarboxyaminoimidazole (NCAIR) mutase